MWVVVYVRGKNAKKFRKNTEYGSARWGTPEDIEPYMDPDFRNNIILTRTERLTMNSRPKDPKTARNKNVLVIGGSGSGKTRFFVKPQLMQLHSSYVVTDPKGSLLVECGRLMERAGYKIKVFNTINFKKSMHYNPFAYIHSEKDILKLVNTLIKVTCVRMYDLVQKYWAAEIETLKIQIKHATQQEAQELERKLQWMQETEMAVVISQEQNEIQTFQKWGLDIKYHREKMEKRELDKEFKDKENPLRIVFVCAMWLTGFDVKCLSCLYLDKPLKAHTLMQTIARANRVAEGKSNGLIVDYIGIVKALRKALADYTANVNGNGGADPTVDKEKLIARILDTISTAEAFLASYGISLRDLVQARDFEKLALLQTAANAVSSTIEEKKTFQTYASELLRLMKYTNREDIELDSRKRYEAIAAIYGELKKKRKTVSNVELMVEINNIISEYVQVEQAAEGIVPSRQFDISQIDFDLLRREFAKAKKKNLVMKDLEDLIRVRLEAMLFNNPDRIKYHERYQQIIEEYNSQQDRATIEKTFDELMQLVKDMDQEEQRYVREGFSSDEELSLYDMLFSENLSKQDIQKIKKVAVDLLEKVKAKIAELDHWTDKQETKATIDNLIRDTLWAELPESYDEVSISVYRQKIYEYVYTRYKNVA